MTDPGETVIRPASVDNPRPHEASAFARLWARRIAGTAFVPGGQRRTHAVLRGLVDRLVAAVVADPPDTDAGYRVGSDLVAAKVADPEVLGRSLTLLDQRLIAELGIAVPGAADRLRTVLGAM